MSSRFPTSVVISILLLGALSPLSAGDNKWTSNGPYGGWFRSFTYHPQESGLVIASEGASLFRSTNSGRTWKRAFSGGGGTCPPVVRIHPRDPGTLVAAASSIYTSTDRGSTWTEISNGPVMSGDDFGDFEFHPSDPQILFGVSEHHGVLKSTDGGKSWIPKNKGLDLPPGENYCGSAQIEVDPTDANVLYVLLVGTTKVYKTSDGGETWRPIMKGLTLTQCAYVLTMDPKTPETLYAGGWDGLFKSTDAGGTWTQTTCGSVASLAIDPQNPQTLYAGPMKSTDGGQTWTELQVDNSGIYANAVDPKRSNVVLMGTHFDGILRSQNGGKAWSFANTGLDAQGIVRIEVDSSHPKHMLANGFTLLFETRDGGETWNLANLSREDNDVGDVTDIQIHPRNPRLIAAAIVNGEFSFAISTDGGGTWTFDRSYMQRSLVAFDPRNQRTVYSAPWERTPTGDMSLGIAKSTDQGRTWKLINSGLVDKGVTAISVDPRTSSRIFAGTESGKIFKSTNGGKKWSPSSTGLSGEGEIGAIEIHPTSSNVVFAATRHGTYKSTDAGHTWSRKNENGEFFVTFYPSDPRAVFTGSGCGEVYVSTDDGETWSTFDATGLGPYNAWDLAIDPSNPSRFFLGTDRGVFSYTRKASAGGPVIEQLSPSSGKPGDAVTINGRGFGQLQSDSKVLFGAVDAGIAQAWSDTSIKVTVPNGVQTGPVTVVVLNKKSNPYEFIVLPASGNVYPTSGPAKGGTRVTILAPSGTSGTQFNVLFGATVAGNVRFAQPNVITCDSPPGTDTVDVKVTSSVTSTAVGTFSYY